MRKRIFLYFILLGILKKGFLHEETQQQKAADETLAVMEEETVTLKSGVTEIQRSDLIVWTYGDTRLAQMNVEPGKISVFEGDYGMFRDKLHLNDQTGDLTITNITTEHAGFYQLQILSSGDFFRGFMVHVSAPLPVPVITRDSSASSVSKCVVLCSVLNVTRVSLSWYKGSSLLSSISVSEHSDKSISLHLECVDDSYTCVLNNPITNQTQHLNADDCRTCSAYDSAYIALIAALCACVLVGVIAAILICCRRHKSKEKVKQKDTPTETELLTNGVIHCKAHQPIYAETRLDEVDLRSDDQRKISLCDKCSRHSSIPFMDDETDDGLYPEEQSDVFEEDIMIKLSVEEGRSVTLHTLIPSIDEDADLIWKFAESKENAHSIRFKVIAERTREICGKISFSTERFQDRLQLNHQTGSLTLTDFTAKDIGYYKLWIPSRKISRTFDVTKKVTTLQRRNTFIY